MKRPLPIIVIADDEPSTLAVLDRVLRMLREPCTPILVPNGRAALAAVQTQPVLLVITDYRMPDMDGLHLTRAIKQWRPETIVILMHSATWPELLDQARAAGVDYTLAKPFDMVDLQTLVRALLAD